MEMIIFLGFLLFLYYLWRYREIDFKVIVGKFVSVLFDNQSKVNDSNKDSDYQESSIPVNVRKTIIEQQFMTLYDVVTIPKKKRDVIKDNEPIILDSKNVDFDNSTTLYDQNGEGHTLYDLASAPVNQAKDSISEIKYIPKKAKKNKGKRNSKLKLETKTTRKQYQHTHKAVNDKVSSVKKNQILLITYWYKFKKDLNILIK